MRWFLMQLWRECGLYAYIPFVVSVSIERYTICIGSIYFYSGFQWHNLLSSTRSYIYKNRLDRYMYAVYLVLFDICICIYIYIVV